MDSPYITNPHQELPQELEISHSTLIQANPVQVYNALATSEGLDAWFTLGARVNAHPGGDILLRWENWGTRAYHHWRWRCYVGSNLTPPIAFQWHLDLQDLTTTVEIDIRPTVDGTIVRFCEHGFADSASGHSAMISSAAGWGEALA